MCGTCNALIKDNYKTIRQASFINENTFIEVDDLIQSVIRKFLVWKQNAETPISVNKSFFYRMASSVAIDARSLNTVNIDNEIEAYERNSNNNTQIHENLISKVKFSNIENCNLIKKLLKNLNIKEKDALLSIATSERVEDYASRNDLSYPAAVKRRRRALKAIQARLNTNDDNIININSREIL